MDSRDFKNSIYGQLARIGKALSSGPRLELLDLLAQGPSTVDALAHQVQQSKANTSHHLQVLARARLVTAAKKGVHVTYRLAGEEVSSLFVAMRRVAEHRLLEIEPLTSAFMEAQGALEEVDREGLISRVRSGEVTVLDVRPSAEFEAGHIPGALSIPLAELESQIASLPPGQEVVAYCRGPYCVMAIDAVAMLRDQGFKASRMEEGVADWRARGFAVEAGR